MMKVFNLEKWKKSWAMIATMFVLMASSWGVVAQAPEKYDNNGDSGGFLTESTLVMVYPPIGTFSTWQLGAKPVPLANGSFGAEPKYDRMADWIVEQLHTISLEPLAMYDSGVLVEVTEEEAATIRSLGLYTSSIPPSNLVSRNGIRMTLEAKNRLTPPKEISGAYLMAFIGPVKHEWFDILEGNGVRFESFVPNYAYVARIPSYSLTTVFSHPFVRAVLPWDTEFKISERLSQSETKAPVRVFLLSDSDINVFVQFAIEQNAEVVSWSDEWGRFVDVIADGALAKDLATHKDVFLIDIQERTKGVFLNDQARWVIQSGVSGSTPIHDHDIRGQFDIITNGPGLVTMADSGLDDEHQDFEDTAPIGPTHRKVEDYYVPPGGIGDDQDNLGHGTHVGGTVLGDSPPYDDYSYYDGHAFGARIIVQDIGPGTDGPFEPYFYWNMFEPAHDAGSRVHTNSYGMIGHHGTYYSVQSQMIDDFVWQTEWRDFVVLFAAGNQFNTITLQSNAKNMISVGATENARPPLDPNDIWKEVGASGSGRGPAGDGRLKPNVLAPGNEVISALSGEASPTWCNSNPVDNFYVPCTGTSMATPAVAGSAQLVRQYFSEGWHPQGIPIEANGFNPSSALVRAMLINSADEITGARTDESDYCRPDLSYCFEYPDNNQGWGRVNLDNVMYFSDDPEPQRRLFAVDEEIGLATSQYVEYVVEIADSTVPFEATLVWTDPMGTFQCDPCLVNNLDLLVVDPFGNEYRGNVFDEESGSWQSKSNPTEPHDPYNVEEAVLRYSPAVGLWTIRVTATSVDPLQGDQPYALVVTGTLSVETRQSYSSGSSHSPAVDTDEGGNAHIVWVEDVGGDNEIFYKKVDLTGRTIVDTYQLTTSDDDLDGDNQYGPVVAVSPTGAIFVFFANEDELPNRRYYIDGKISVDGGQNWDDLRMYDQIGDHFNLFLTTDSLNDRDVIDTWRPIDVEIDASGIVHILYTFYWTGVIPEYESLRYTKSMDPLGTGWQTKQILYQEPYPYDPGFYPHTRKLRSPNIAQGIDLHAIYSYDDMVDPIGGPYVGPSFIIPLRSTNNGDSWHTTVPFVAVTDELARESALEADYSGNVYAVWQDKTGVMQHHALWFSRSASNGDGWEVPMFIPDSAGDNIQPFIRLESTGYIHLVWSGGSLGMYRLYHISSTDNGFSWEGCSRGLLSFAPGSFLAPVFTMDSSNRLNIVWQSDGGNSESWREIYYQYWL